MAKTAAKKTDTSVSKQVKVLISQPKPESEKSPYFELARKHNLELFFFPFIQLEGIQAKEFRKQKIDITQFSAVIFTSRNAIDHFFRMCDEMKVTVSQETKYFCVTEAVALYLQKFILYRKRKVFYGADGTNKSLFDVINKHKNNERFLYVCSENQQDNEIVNWLKSHKCEFAMAFMYRTVSSDIRPLFQENEFSVICFFTPSGIKSLKDNFPEYAQQQAVIGTFGTNTAKAAEEAGLQVEIKAPLQAPSMVAALDIFFGKK
jgi:uroporphyrinogen-III synthase